MAPRKAKPAPAARKAAAPASGAGTARKAAAPAPASASGRSDPSRLLREAAWSRMFGRTETKNPFTR